jgi:hypothetical protein
MKKPTILFFILDLFLLYWFTCNGLVQDLSPDFNLLVGRSLELVVFLGAWLFFSLVFKKFSSIDSTFLIGLRNLLMANICTFGLVILLDQYLGVPLFTLGQLCHLGIWMTIGESLLFFFFLNVGAWLAQNEMPDPTTINKYLEEFEQADAMPFHLDQDGQSKEYQRYRKLLHTRFGDKVFDFFADHFNFSEPQNVVVEDYSGKKGGEIPGVDNHGVLSLRLINHFPRINKFFEAVNSGLVTGGIFICGFRPQRIVEEKILRKWPPVLNWLLYFFHFMFKRIFPKLKGTKGLYFYLTRGRNRCISRIETLGRLYSCGFKYVEEFQDGEYLFFVTVKVKEPAFDMQPSYGPVFKMRRIGKDGKEICIYKLRTMYPYSEYLQEYLYEKHQLGEGGKISNDIRITPVGRILRKCWLDELPNLLNVFKGQMKLIGVRPLSHHYLSLYDKELQELRKKVKPGLIPPFYADLPKTLEEIQLSEKRYIESYLKRPLLTDLQYLKAAFKNVVWKGAFSS